MIKPLKKKRLLISGSYDSDELMIILQFPIEPPLLALNPLYKLQGQ